MSFRDDHDAAVARVDALERELATAKADDAAQDEAIARLTRELAVARHKLARAEAELETLRPPPPKPIGSKLAPTEPATTPPPKPNIKVIAAIAIASLVFIIAMVVVTTRSERDVEARDPMPEKTQPPPTVATGDRVSSIVGEALALAAERFSGGKLTGFTGAGIDETGAPHPTFGRVEIELHRHVAEVPARIDPTLPVGAPQPEPTPARDECLTLVYENGKLGPRFDLGDFYPCFDVGGNRSVDPPACTASAIWKRAIDDGAPHDAIAKIEYDGMWEFRIDDPRVTFFRAYVDDCVPAER